MDVAGIEAAVARVLELTPAECLEAAENARERYRALAAGFREAFRGLLGRLGFVREEEAPAHHAPALVHPPRKVLAFSPPPPGRHVDPLPEWKELPGPFKDPQGRHPAWDWVLPCLLERPDELLAVLEWEAERGTKEQVEQFASLGEGAFVRKGRLVAVYARANAGEKLEAIYRQAALSQSAAGPLLAIRDADVLPLVLLD